MALSHREFMNEFDFARYQKNNSTRFSDHCVFTQPAWETHAQKYPSLKLLINPANEIVVHFGGLRQCLDGAITPMLRVYAGHGTSLICAKQPSRSCCSRCFRPPWWQHSSSQANTLAAS